MPKRKNPRYPVGLQQKAKKARHETADRLQADFQAAIVSILSKEIKKKTEREHPNPRCTPAFPTTGWADHSQTVPRKGQCGPAELTGKSTVLTQDFHCSSKKLKPNFFPPHEQDELTAEMSKIEKARQQYKIAHNRHQRLQRRVNMDLISIHWKM